LHLVRISHQRGAICPTAARGKSHRKKEIPFWGNTTHTSKIAVSQGGAKCRRGSEQEFVVELENLKVSSAKVCELTKNLGFEYGLDVIEENRKRIALFELAEL
jgi:hypothetical protein